MFHLVEDTKYVQIGAPKDWTGAAHTTEYIKVANADKAWFVINCGVLTSTSAQAVTLYVANDAAGTKNKAITSAGGAATLTIDHYYKRAASTDTFTKTAIASSTFNIAATDDGTTFVIPVDLHKAGTFVASSVTYNAEFIRLSVATPGAHACLQDSFCILTGLRYHEDSPPTAIA